MPPKPMTDDEVQRTLTRAIEDARAFVDAEVAEDRILAQKYFDGSVALEAEDGRSKVVATKCRDTVRAIKPVLMRVFLQTDKPVEFVPRHPGAVAAAQQATSYASYIFARNDGFRVLSDAFHDALIKKVGIVKVTYDETPEVEVDEYTNLPPEVVQFIMQDAEAEVLEQEEQPDGSVNLKLSRTTTKGTIRFDSVPPEDFFVDRAARNTRDCLVCGHSNPDARVGDVVAMGFDFEEVLDLAGTEDNAMADEEEFARTGWDNADEDSPLDPSMRKVLLTEAYMRMDIEGTGVPRSYKFICAGPDYSILEKSPCDMNPFAVFEVDPEPHTFFGRSLVDLIIEDQDAATSMLRGLLDSIQMANNPRIWAQEGQVNMQDLLNNEIGGVVRVKMPGAVGEFTVGANTAAVLPAMQFYDESIRAKTGVMGAAMGLNPNALAKMSATGADAIQAAAQAQSELIARNLAEGGMRQLFEKIAQLARQHPDPEGMIRVDGQFVPVDPRSWTAAMDVVANVGLGTGKHEERMMMLQMTLQDQMMLAQTGSPLVTQTGMRATRADLLALAGIHNADRYYAAMTPEIEQQIAAQAAQAAQQPPQPTPDTMALLQAEQMKAQQRAQADAGKLQLAMIEAQAEDDLKRDELDMRYAIEMAKLGAKQDEAVMRAQMAAQRPYGPQAAPQQGPQGF